MDYAMPIASEFPPFELDSTVTLTTVNPRNYSGLLTACGSSQEVFVLRAVPPAAAQPAAQKDANRQRRRGIRHLTCYEHSLEIPRWWHQTAFRLDPYVYPI